MLHYRKNVGGAWEVCSLTKEEAKAIQVEVLKIGLSQSRAIKKLAEENKIEVSDGIVCAILAKVVPSYESLANDYIEGQIKKKFHPEAA